MTSVPHAGAMQDLPPPLGIPTADWAGTPPAVRVVVQVLLAQVEAHEALPAEVERLKAQVAELEAQLARHSGNSSQPPSSDPPGAPPRPAKAPSGRKRGGQPGHAGHQRELLPPDQVAEVVTHPPTVCGRCHHLLPANLPCSGPLLRQQVWELPVVQPTVIEHQFPTVTCPSCQAAVRADRPPTVPPGSFGPRLTALIALLHGRYRLSTREVVRLLDDLWQLPISLGSIPALYQAVGAAVAAPYQAVQTAVQAQAVVNVDETGWREARTQRYLWVAVTVIGTRFLVARRSRATLDQLLGPTFGGIVGSDRYRAYAARPPDQRQVCWAHLKRDVTFFAEREGPVGIWGTALLAHIERLFASWHQFRSGALDRRGLQAALAPIQAEVDRLLDRGRDDLPWEKARGFCRDLRELGSALWTFATVDGVEPTNNAAERALRPAVLWRTGCYGTDSSTGSRFVERLLTVTATCQQHQRPVLPFLTDVMHAHWSGSPMPSLIPTP